MHPTPLRACVPPRPRALSAILIAAACALPAHAARLGPLEQIPVEQFAKLREVERYQMKIAEKYYLQENWKVAMAEYEKFLRLYERSVGAPYAQLMWSHCLRQERRVNTAIKDGYQSVIDYWPDSPQAVIAKFEIARSYKMMGEMRPARKAYAKVIQDHPDHITAVLAKVDQIDIARIDQDEERRLELWQDLAFKTERNKQNEGYCADAARHLARHHFYKADWDKAVEALETTWQDGSLVYRIWADTRSPISHLTGDAETREKGLKLADRVIAYMEQAIPADLEDEKNRERGRQLTYWIADIHNYARRDDKVFQTYERIGKVYGTDDNLLSHMAQWYKNHKQRDKARETYAKFEDQIKGQAAIAYMWREEGKYTNAITIYTDLMKLDAEHADDWQWEIGECYRADKKYTEAINTFRQTDKFPRNYMVMAACHRELKQWNEALVLYNQVLSIQDAAPQAQLQIGYTYEQAGKKEQAIKSFQAVCKKYPKQGEASRAHAHLQNAYKITVTLGGAKEE